MSTTKAGSALVMATGRTHVLKTWPRYWLALDEGRKTFEVRRDDRAFAEGDTLVLRFYDPLHDNWCDVEPDHCIWDHHRHEDDDLRFVVTYVLPGGQFGIEPGHVVLGLRPA